MAQYWRHACEHTSLRSLSGQGETALSGLCAACLDARIGQPILFARHGKAPKGASRNHRDGTAEAGVSVYEIVDGTIQYCGWWFEIADRPLYLGEGTIVGWGSDGEPLVAITALRKATAQEKKALRQG